MVGVIPSIGAGFGRGVAVATGVDVGVGVGFSVGVVPLTFTRRETAPTSVRRSLEPFFR